MRPRTPSIIWIPFVFSIGTIAWALLFVGIGLLAALILTPAIRDVKAAEGTRNDYQATLDLLDQQVALQKEFSEAATKDPVLMERLASRQLNLNRPDQELLVLDPAQQSRDRSVQALLAESLKPVKPKPVPAMNMFAAMALSSSLRPLLITFACGVIALSFFLSVRYERA
jgi:hypothetical protein